MNIHTYRNSWLNVPMPAPATTVGAYGFGDFRNYSQHMRPAWRPLTDAEIANLQIHQGQQQYMDMKSQRNWIAAGALLALAWGLFR